MKSRILTHSVSSSLYHRDLHITSVGINISPVLVSLGILSIVLEINTILGKYNYWSDNAIRQVDMGFPSCSIASWDIVWYILSNIVIKCSVPGR